MKHFLVAGSGISGMGAVRLLKKQPDVKITLYDGNKQLEPEALYQKMTDAGIENCREVKIVLGELPDEVIAGTDVMILSPGIAIDAEFVNRVRERNVPVWGEIELAYRYTKGRVIGITGTNGKTTTTALVGEIMKNHFESVFVVGNIGTPYTSVALETREDSVIVAEISSFQLESVLDFHPVATAVLNITPDHLNRHYTMENYASVKMSITKNQTKDEVCVLNYEDAWLKDAASTVPAKVVYFSSKSDLTEGICIKDNQIVVRESGMEQIICGIHDMELVGIHNIENVMAAIAIARYMEVPVEVIRDTIAGFHAVEHRIEYVTTKNGVIYYNDSKGTNTDASIKAIEAMSKPTVLIAGGYDKGSEYDEWIDAFGDKIKHLVLLGATKEKIAKTADKKGYQNYTFVESLEEAVRLSAEIAKDNEVVLLSPACASWDMFQSYEERGRLFKEYVLKL